MIITFFSRPGCHICDEALEALEEFIAEMNAGPATGGSAGSFTADPVKVDVVNIESDDELHRRYLERIPVIKVGKLTVSELGFDPEALESALRD
ncbi:MAG: glutaredoxin family protein [Solirubrobacterales bacterium]|nr:glutaredoxin family protein [Solirubrobacterales bacterium]MCB8916145.1 glutaredoxin family protein [Thermoleophilales bacterium]